MQSRLFLPTARQTNWLLLVGLLALATWKRRSNVPAAEKAMAVTLAVSAVYIVGNESFANWQALWFAAALLALALTLVQARDVPS